MLLNQMRCEDGDPENLLKNSFYQFQSDRALPDLEVSGSLQANDRWLPFSLAWSDIPNFN